MERKAEVPDAFAPSWLQLVSAERVACELRHLRASPQGAFVVTRNPVGFVNARSPAGRVRRGPVSSRTSVLI